MKEKKEKIDLLFERNAAEQLAGVDWDGLNRAISGRLDQADQRKTSAMRYRRIIKSAAALAAAAAVILIAVMVNSRVLLKKGQDAVELVKTVAPDTKPTGRLTDKTDTLLAKTDPKTILLTGELHFLSNDPLLRPHSVWDQKPVCKIFNNYEKEAIQ